MKLLRFVYVIILAAMLAACGGSIPNTGQPVRVGSKDTVENQLLGEMYAQVLQASGIPVERKLNLGNTQKVHQALVDGDIDVYPEYTGTAYLLVMEMKDGEKDPAMINEKVRKYYERRWDLTWLTPAPLSNMTAIAVTADAANKYNLRTISDLARSAPNLRLAVTSDFQQRPDGMAALEAAYGSLDFHSVSVVDSASRYEALQNGQADAVVGFATDGQIRGQNLMLLNDDQRAWVNYQATPAVRKEVLERYPQMADALNKLSELLTSQRMAELNWKVEGERQDVTQVAAEFLRGSGLIK
ncbi:MAG TPA: glycine betaine ABC transporter substrate-binding protein [Anaerolineaceae bacterium]